MDKHHSPKKYKEQKGSALKHGKVHQSHHSHWSRRSFLKGLGIMGGGSVMLGSLPVLASGSNALSVALSNANSDRVMVMIRLKGGNDGLNTLIPLYDYSTYATYRPNIRIPENQSWKLTDEIAMPNYTNALRPLWEEGKMKAIHSVGYPDQNLSHFTSADIWASGENNYQPKTSGFMGRYFDYLYPDYLTNPPAQPPAVQIGSLGNLTFNNPNNLSMGISVFNPEQLHDIAQTGQLHDLDNLPDCFYGDQVGYVRALANTTFIYAEAIKEAYDAASNAVTYESFLGEQLALVARLIKGNLGAKVYMVTLDGFDTHAGQPEQHEALLTNLATDVNNFYQDLEAGSWNDKVLSMTVSEFGRRAFQNASSGTDHGAAAPLFFFGDGLNGNGLLGSLPDLNNLDSVGNLKFETDFRSVYATVMEHWLCIDADVVDTVLGDYYERISLGVDCLNVGTNSSASVAPQIVHKAIYRSNDQVAIRYSLPEAMRVRVEIFNVLGQPVAQLYEGMQMAGQHEHGFKNPYLARGVYYYRILVGNTAFSNPIRLAN